MNMIDQLNITDFQVFTDENSDKSVSKIYKFSKKCEGFVNACGLLLKNGKRNHVWEIKITDENETLISQITVVNALVPQKNSDK